MRKLRYYLIDLNVIGDFYLRCSDEEFMSIAEEQGFVYSLEGFQDAFNNCSIDQENCILRII